MDQTSEDNVEKYQRKRCNCTTTKTTILFLVITILNFTITGCLVVVLFYQGNELREVGETSAKAIADCRRHVAMINTKFRQDTTLKNRQNSISTQRNIIRKSPAILKQEKDLNIVANQEAKTQRKIRCPYCSQKRRRLYSFIAKEVTKAKLNMTELRKEIKNVLAEKDKEQLAYFNFLGKHQYDLQKVANVPRHGGNNNDADHCNYDVIKHMYKIKWDFGRQCEGVAKKKKLHWCRLTYYSQAQYSSGKDAIQVKVPGIYLLYCQLTFSVKDSNVANLTSKVSILMSKPSINNKVEHVELISQVPVLTKQGNEDVVTVSMVTQAKLYQNSYVSVTVSFKDNLKIPHSAKKLILYNRKKPFNVFGMNLLKKKRNDGQ